MEKDMFQKLVEWFLQNKRDLPWRHTKDPYKIWVSEIMLQQTRVDTVIDYYRRFLERFPTVYHLAEAEEQEVLLMWQGLGYYSRGRNLHQGAKVIVSEYEGIFPKTVKEAMKIKGVGRYTAGAILSIAYGIPVAAVDGNVLRVFTRIFDLPDDIANPQTVKKIEEMVTAYIVTDHASNYTEGLMELGAMVCTPTQPKCDECPMRRDCMALKNGTVEIRPQKAQKPKPVISHRLCLVIKNEDKLLLIKNPPSGLLGGMWGLPCIQKESSETNETELNDVFQALAVKVNNFEEVGTVRHIFTHMDWRIQVIRCEGIPMQEVEGQWIYQHQLKEFPLPKVFQKVLSLAGY